MSLRLVNLGLPKSGTSTLARALRRGCLSCADHKITPRTDKIDNSETYVGELMYQGLYDLGDPAAYLEGFDSISEMSVLREGKSIWPQTDFAIIDALRRLHPDLLFVATKRDAFKMSQSMLAWSNLGDRLEKTDIPGLPAGFGETSKARMQWIEAHYAHLRAIFGDDPRFLELDVAAEDARGRLAAHLGIDLPWWGRRNSNPLTKAV
ncbi:hypothetical protein [Aestuariivita boseongensis]|uniref:hypothetical protein n=1 Tax=Aestuariivita boseongensis TaxID=1470562 RepID=UPI00067FDE26|nr:hypothetical protein [Aestuariivita boseongensis]